MRTHRPLIHWQALHYRIKFVAWWYFHRMEIQWTWTAWNLGTTGMLFCLSDFRAGFSSSPHLLTPKHPSTYTTQLFLASARLGSPSLHYKIQNLLFSIQVSPQSIDRLHLFLSLLPTSEQEPSASPLIGCKLDMLVLTYIFCYVSLTYRSY